VTALIALYSPYPQSGKGTFAKGLAAVVPGTVVLKFADAMREVVIPFVAPFFDGGEAEVREWLEDERKDNKLIPTLGVTLRHMLQSLGTAWGRKLIHPDLWVLIAREALRRARTRSLVWGGSPDVKLVVFDDLRMENEYSMLLKEGATMIRIERPDSPPTKAHESNAQLEGLSFDFHIRNEGMDDLRRKAKTVAEQLGL